MARDATLPDALTQLRTEHSYLASLLGELEREPDPVRARGLFRTWYEELRAHSSAERTVFYAALAADGATELVRHALAAHEHIDELARELVAASPSQPAWRETLQALRWAVEAYADEEERTLFTIAGREIGGDALQAMGAQLIAAAARWREAECAGRHAVPSREPRTAALPDC